MEVKNRIVMSPMLTYSHGPEGEILDKTVNYYEERAKSGIGLIICQSSVIMRESRAPHRASAYDDKFIPGLKRIADVIHKYDAKAAFQLVHHGRLLTDYRYMVDHPEEIKALVPSSTHNLPRFVEIRGTKEERADILAAEGDLPPIEATKEDIKRIVQGFAEAARRIKDAGFDAVEIHGGHGYLISQFLSPLDNRRADEYGGSTEKRAHFACEVIEATKEKVGKDFPVLFRFSGTDFMPGGINIEESKQQAPLFVEAGADGLDVSAHGCRHLGFLFPQGPRVFLSAEVKKVVTVPVITVGKIIVPDFADQVISQGQADFVALGRALLADSQWANKARQKRFEEIRACISCLNCFDFFSQPKNRRKGLRCSVNPALLREKEFVLKPAAVSKKIMVIGGGPAGMEAARTLAERGHRVTLFEKNSHLGGQWYIACQQPQKKHDYPKLLMFLQKGLQKTGVDVRLNTRVNLDTVKQENPGAVILATGAIPLKPNVNGAEGQNVIMASDVILGNAKTGKTVTVVGGRNLGMEIADQLADEGKEVHLVSRRIIGRGLELNNHLTLFDRLVQKGVNLYPHSPLVEIRQNGVYVVFNNELLFLKTETVVLAVGFKSENIFYEELRSHVDKLYQIGDCVKPRNVMCAIREGAEIGRAI
jgi:2,4-dienoyl-CoA reductase-like NADH-dependent reductase (Old Yellow Enzyme family)/NADPH-dependent glutamate synthase beta subunit-like oxidoreductase